MALMSFTVWHQSNFPACLYLPVHISCRVILQIFQRDKELQQGATDIVFGPV